MSRFEGSCHCGRVTFEVLAQPSHLGSRNCSLCSAKGALYLPVGEVSSVTVTAGAGDLSEYRFYTHTATHFFCRHCGTLTPFTARESTQRAGASMRAP